MPIKPFVYLSPRSVEEACTLMKEHADDAKILAGGQSLLPLLKLNLAEVSYLIDLKRVSGLSSITADERWLVVGALVTQAEIARSELVRQNVPLLAETARGIGHPLVRNRGTLGGSISHCDPASDLCATSLALDAEITLVRHDGIRRKVKAQDFLTGTFETAIGKGEILEKVSIPISPKNSGYSFRKFTVGHGDFPLVVVSVLLSFAGEKCVGAAIALGGVADRVIRAPRAEEILTQCESLQDEAVARAVAAAEDSSRPSSDLEVSAVYKKRLVGVLVRRAIAEAAERGRGARQ